MDTSCTFMCNVFGRYFYFRRIAILAVVAMNSSKIRCFSEHELQQGYIIVTKYGTSVVSGMYLWKDSLLEFEGYCVYLWKTIVALLFSRCPYIPQN